MKYHLFYCLLVDGWKWRADHRGCACGEGERGSGSGG
jgi:hypothetical protein